MKHETLEGRLIAMLAQLTLPELRILRARFANDPEELERVNAAIAKKVERGAPT